MPRDTPFDSTLAIALDGYEFISKRCERLSSDVFEARLMLRRTICLRGEEAARLFYDPEKFMRQPRRCACRRRCSAAAVCKGSTACSTTRAKPCHGHRERTARRGARPAVP